MASKFHLFFLFVYVLALCQGNFNEDRVPAPPSSEVYAIQQFCKKLLGCEEHTGWNLHADATVLDPCKEGWEGVKCLYDAKKEITHIHFLDLHDKPFTGPLGPALATLQALPFLEHIAIYNCNLTGRISDLNLPRLKLLRLDQNNLSGTIPAVILRSSKDLRYLDLSRNPLRIPIPDFTSLLKIEQIHLYECELTGELPWGLGMLPHLRELRLDSNQLVGTLPAFARDSQDIKRIEASGAVATDAFANFPGRHQQLRSLIYLDLHGNALTGTLPESFASLISLKALLLYANLLTGSIPEAFGDLIQLNSMRLDSNHLSGRIPHTLSKLTNLEFLGTGGKFNKLHGQVPDFVQYRRNITSAGRVCDPSLVGNSTERQKYEVAENWDSTEEMLHAIKLAALVFTNSTARI